LALFGVSRPSSYTIRNYRLFLVRFLMRKQMRKLSYQKQTAAPTAASLKLPSLNLPCSSFVCPVCGPPGRQPTLLLKPSSPNTLSPRGLSHQGLGVQFQVINSNVYHHKLGSREQSRTKTSKPHRTYFDMFNLCSQRCPSCTS
jgi:hypothetical protein